MLTAAPLIVSVLAILYVLIFDRSPRSRPRSRGRRGSRDVVVRGFHP